MADTKISALPELTGANTASVDMIPIVDQSAVQTKKITLGELQAAPVSAGTANGILYLNGSKVASSGSALTFDGSGVLGMFAAAGPELRFSDAAYYSFVKSVVSGGNSFLAFGVNASEAMRLTTTGLGIGTSSPGSKLEVNGGAANTEIRLNHTDNTPGRALTLRMSSTAGGGAYAGAGAYVQAIQGTGVDSYSLAFGTTKNSTSATERARIDASGNLGLGVTPSASWYSSVKAMQLGSTGAVLGRTNNEIVVLASNAYNSGASTADYAYLVSANYATRYQQSSGQHLWFTAPSGTAGDAISFSQAMTLDASGRLGIGTSSPSKKLDVKGDIRSAITDSGDGTGVLLTNNGSTNGLIEFVTSDATGRYRLEALGDSGFAVSTLAYGSWGQAFYIDRVSRNLGLGVTPSAWGFGKAFEVANNGSALWGAGVNDLRAMSNATYDTGYKYVANGYANMYINGTANGSHTWFTAPSGTAGAAISFTQAMTLFASGGLALANTVDPGYGNLSVNATAFIGASAGACYVPDDGVFGGVIKNGGGFKITTASVERFRLDTSGNLIHTVTGTAPTLSTNSTMSFELTSNTSLKIVVRGSDGTTRSASLTLA